MNKDIKEMIPLLNIILDEAYKIRKLNEISNLWLKYIDTVIDEMEELLFHALKGQIYFKYGKKQRMLQSSYLISDSFEPLADTSLGKNILELQKFYWKL